VADPDPRDIPDLDLPPPRASSAELTVPSARAQPGPSSAGGPPGSFGGDFGMALERGPVSTTPASTSRVPAGPQVAISIESDDDFGLEIERGGAMASLVPASSGRPIASTNMSGRPAAPGSGLEVTYRRLDPKAVVESGPGVGEKIAARALPFVIVLATTGALAKLAHRRGGRNILSFLPHAFDATSTVQSGAFAIGALVVAIAIGFIGLKLTPRSYAMLGSAAALLVGSLAMVTVTLVSTDENPIPPDGALLIPYVIPAGLFLLGLGIAGRGPSLFLAGGARRIAAGAAALCGGAIVFAALEISALAAHLP
jgi:hypothetical protein